MKYTVTRLNGFDLQFEADDFSVSYAENHLGEGMSRPTVADVTFYADRKAAGGGYTGRFNVGFARDVITVRADEIPATAPVGAPNSDSPF